MHVERLLSKTDESAHLSPMEDGFQTPPSTTNSNMNTTNSSSYQSQKSDPKNNKYDRDSSLTFFLVHKDQQQEHSPTVNSPSRSTHQHSHRKERRDTTPKDWFRKTEVDFPVITIQDAFQDVKTKSLRNLLDLPADMPSSPLAGDHQKPNASTRHHRNSVEKTPIDASFAFLFRDESPKFESPKSESPKSAGTGLGVAAVCETLACDEISQTILVESCSEWQWESECLYLTDQQRFGVGEESKERQDRIPRIEVQIPENRPVKLNSRAEGVTTINLCAPEDEQAKRETPKQHLRHNSEPMATTRLKQKEFLHVASNFLFTSFQHRFGTNAPLARMTTTDGERVCNPRSLARLSTYNSSVAQSHERTPATKSESKGLLRRPTLTPRTLSSICTHRNSGDSASKSKPRVEKHEGARLQFFIPLLKLHQLNGDESNGSNCELV